MKKICLSKVLEDEAKECEESARVTTMGYSEVFHILSISYRSLAKRLRAEATPYKETDARKNS